MKKKDIHNLIEQQDLEAKQRLWEKISSRIDVAPAPQQTAVKTKPKMWKWAVAFAVLVVVTLSVVLPLTLTDGGVRYCDITQYTAKSLGQTLGEYSSSHNNELLYVNWYENADELSTYYAHMNDDINDIVYFEETIVNGNTGEAIILAVTNNKTRVDKFQRYYEIDEELIVMNVSVKWQSLNNTTIFAMFEYKNHNYYLQLELKNGQDQMVEIIENMLNAQ